VVLSRQPALPHLVGVTEELKDKVIHWFTHKQIPTFVFSIAGFTIGHRLRRITAGIPTIFQFPY